MIRRAIRIGAIAAIATVSAAHIGSPDVFFTGAAGPYDVRVVIRPPEVVPGIARVTVRRCFARTSYPKRSQRPFGRVTTSTLPHASYS